MEILEQGERLLSQEETAARLGVSVRTVSRLVERGKLRAVKVGRATRIPMASVNTYLGGEPASDD